MSCCAKVVNDKLVFAPYEDYTEEGYVIELDSYEKCVANGYKVVAVNKPFYDREKYSLKYAGFTEEKDIIIVHYELVEKVSSDEVLEDLINTFNEEINK